MWTKTLPDYIREMRSHNPQVGKPHWSTGVYWRPGRWDSLSSAPSMGYEIMHVRGRSRKGEIFEPMHYAHGDGDGMQPPFVGWFVPYPNKSSGFYEVHPVEWQPLHANPVEDFTGASALIP